MKNKVLLMFDNLLKLLYFLFIKCAKNFKNCSSARKWRLIYKQQFRDIISLLVVSQ
jgi:hypothetical protein